MQGLADGYFVLPYTIQNYLADQITVPRFSTDLPEDVYKRQALIARDLWDMNEYFRVMNTTNESVQKALEILNSEEYQKLSLIHI